MEVHMLEKSIIWLAIAAAAVYLGRRLWRQWRAAVAPGKSISCDCGCSGCNVICDEKRQPQPRR
ncbi:MAG: FeoB-associated Cys-rich membrane protein [Desulfobulbaceae bacterium]|nr:MAG: FeoB-associated Cys-rich membrane protein [Desulfobulbaceae bacterium]